MVHQDLSQTADLRIALEEATKCLDARAHELELAQRRALHSSAKVEMLTSKLELMEKVIEAHPSLEPELKYRETQTNDAVASMTRISDRSDEDKSKSDEDKSKNIEKSSSPVLTERATTSSENSDDNNDGGGIIDGVTPLHTYSKLGNHKMVRALIWQRADVNEQSNNGNTALHYASFHGHYSVVKTLVELKGDVNIFNKEGRTPLDIASQGIRSSDAITEEVQKGHDKISQLFAILEANRMQELHHFRTLKAQFKPVKQLDALREHMRTICTVDDLLAPKTTCRFQFLKYLKQNSFESFAAFLQAIEPYPKLSFHRRQILARTIYMKHCMPGIQLCISERRGVEKRMDRYESFKHPQHFHHPHSPVLQNRCISTDRGESSTSCSQENSPPIFNRELLVRPSTSQGPKNARDSFSRSFSIDYSNLPFSEPSVIHPSRLSSAPLGDFAGWLCKHHSRLSEDLREQLKEAKKSLFDDIYGVVKAYLDTAARPGFVMHKLFDLHVQFTERSRKQTYNDFKYLYLCGRGTFGPVTAAVHKASQKTFCIKQMDKALLRQRDSEQLILNEKLILGCMHDSPFVLSLDVSFQTDDSLYLVVELLGGGDLEFLLDTQEDARPALPGLVESEKRASMKRRKKRRARFYCGQVLLGLEHLHKKNILCRDIKPTSILLNAEGHALIGHLRLAKKLRHANEICQEVVGTPGYMAPEVMKGQGTYRVSDFWSWGVLLFEMLTGEIPEAECNTDEHEWTTWSNCSKNKTIMHFEDSRLVTDCWYPTSKLDPDAIDLFKKLFVEDPRKRLGAKGINEIKRHTFFKNVEWEWEHLANCEITPPYTPYCEAKYVRELSLQSETMGLKDVNNINGKKKKLKAPSGIFKHFDWINGASLQQAFYEALVNQGNAVKEKKRQQKRQNDYNKRRQEGETNTNRKNSPKKGRRQLKTTGPSMKYKPAKVSEADDRDDDDATDPKKRAACGACAVC